MQSTEESESYENSNWYMWLITVQYVIDNCNVLSRNKLSLSISRQMIILLIIFITRYIVRQIIRLILWQIFKQIFRLIIRLTNRHIIIQLIRQLFRLIILLIIPHLTGLHHQDRLLLNCPLRITYNKYFSWLIIRDIITLIIRK